MDKDRYLDNLTNMLNTVAKLKGTYSRSNTGDSILSSGAGRREMLTEMLRVVSEHSPENHKRLMGDTLEKSRKYCDAYKCIKEHFRDVRKQSRSNGSLVVEKDNLLKTLRVMKPVLDTRRAEAIEKVMKIYEVLKS